MTGVRILVTGGTGSFGHHYICRLLATCPEMVEVRSFSRDEQKHVEQRRAIRDTRLISVVGDVRDYDACLRAAAGCTHVFHAAAMKHVDVIERTPWEAVQTNVHGTWNMVRAADAAGVGRLVGISTDKAVEPVNAYGFTKGLMEKILTAYTPLTSDMQVTAVRYGNVFASKGSVVPLFRKLLAEGAEELPITSRQMTRFILTLDQASDLVAYAARRAHGTLWVPDLPAVHIVDLARAMLKRAGREPDMWHEVGIRPGEKIHETLLSLDELRRARRVEGHYAVTSVYVAAAAGPTSALTSEHARRMSSDELHAILDTYEAENP